MTAAARRYYPVPVSGVGGLANFTAWGHLSRIFQADYYKAQIQRCRAGSGWPERQLGSLYWQLEDQWPGAPTWSGIEYDGRWKPLHYVARDIYQPLIVAPVFNVSTGILRVYVVSDLWSAATGTIDLRWLSWSGDVVDGTTPMTAAFAVGAINSTLVAIFNITASFSKPPSGNAALPAADAVLLASVTATGTPPNGATPTTYAHTNTFTPTPLASASLVDPRLALAYDESRDVFQVRAAAGVSAWTWLDVADEDGAAGLVVVFADNAFALAKSEERTVGYTVLAAGPAGWQKRVTVRSIWDRGL